MGTATHPYRTSNAAHAETIFCVRSRYVAAGLAMPRNVSFVASPFDAIVAGGLTAGVWHAAQEPNALEGKFLSRWLDFAPPHEGLLEHAISGGTRGVLTPRRIDRASSAGSYPPGWSNEDRFVWDATASLAQMKLRGALQDAQRLNASASSHDTSTDGPRPSQSLQQNLSSLVRQAVEASVWDLDPEESRFGHFVSGLSEGSVESLCRNLFGDDAHIGTRLIRLATRMMEYGDGLPVGRAVGEGSHRESNVFGPTAVAPWFVHPDFCLVCGPPERLFADEQGRPHCSDGPFCSWSDGSALYAIHGVPVAARVVERPETMTVAEIDAQQNAEVRRVMIERFGCDRYLRESGAEAVDAEPGIGTLYRRRMRGDEPVAMVEVVNSTPEPDGTLKHYWLRVPPDTQTARDAVAWTFGVGRHAYAPQIET